MLGIAVLDSINPSTIAPALALATGSHPSRALAAFTTGVFAVSTVGGLVLTLGPARSILQSLAKPSAHTRHVGELVLGIFLLAVAAALWRFRSRIWSRSAGTARRARSAGAVGAAIMAVELPTAVPYLGAMLAVAQTTRSAVTETILILAYNVVFVAPLLALLVLSRFAGAGTILVRFRALTYTVAPHIVPIGLGVVGVILAIVGAAGL